MSWLVVKLDERLNIIDIDSAKTSGLAHQKALVVTDSGFRCRVVEPEDGADVAYLFDQVMQKREMGFIKEYGQVPNGSRSGDGCRTIGKMIYPAFGGMLEGLEGASDQGSQPESLQTPISLPLSSEDFEKPPEKIVFLMRRNN